MFASIQNFKCVKYVAWKLDPKAFAIEGYTLYRSEFALIYAFPSYSLLRRGPPESQHGVLEEHSHCVSTMDRLNTVDIATMLNQRTDCLTQCSDSSSRTERQTSAGL